MRNENNLRKIAKNILTISALFEIICKFAQNVFEIKGKFNINILIQNL